MFMRISIFMTVIEKLESTQRFALPARFHKYRILNILSLCFMHITKKMK